MSTATLDTILTLEEAAEFLRVTPRYLADFARDGNIRAMKMARKWVFPASMLAEFVEEQTKFHQPEKSGLETELAPPPAWDPYERSMPRRKFVRL